MIIKIIPNCSPYSELYKAFCSIFIFLPAFKLGNFHRCHKTTLSSMVKCIWLQKLSCRYYRHWFKFSCMNWTALLYSRWCDGTVALLASCIPDLSLHCLAVHLDAACGKLHSDGAFTLQVELITGETGQQVTLSHTRVTDKNNWNTKERKHIVLQSYNL